MATFTPEIVADDKMKPEDMVPQADQQSHTEIAERESRQGEQAHVINEEEAKRGMAGSVQHPIGRAAPLSMRVRRASQKRTSRQGSAASTQH